MRPNAIACETRPFASVRFVLPSPIVGISIHTPAPDEPQPPSNGSQRPTNGTDGAKAASQPSQASEAAPVRPEDGETPKLLPGQYQPDPLKRPWIVKWRAGFNPASRATTFGTGAHRRCTATSKKRQARCKNPAIGQRNVCRFHGGTSGAPLKTGRYSKAMTEMRESYESALQDPGLDDLREPLALLHVAVEKCVARAETGDSPEFRTRARSLYRSAREALAAGDGAEAGRVMTELGRHLDVGVQHDRAIARMVETVVAFGQRVEKSWDIRLAKKQAINARDLLAVMKRFLDVVMTEAGGLVARKVAESMRREILNARLLRSEGGIGATDLEDFGVPEPAVGTN